MSIYSSQDRYLPVRPDLDQLKHQAKDLLKAVRNGEPEAIEEFNEFHPGPPAPAEAQLADAQLALARAYEAPNWTRLVQACELVAAIWRDDIDAVRSIVTKDPKLIHEDALVRKSNWGPPMSYAANLGRNEIVKLLADLGAKDFQHALDRAALQSKIDTAELLHKYMGAPLPPDGALAGPAYTLSDTGTAFALRAGARVLDYNGKSIAPIDVVLETDSRKPAAKHAILEMYAAHGHEYPDTAIWAFHRGRVDLLDEYLRRDPQLLSRRFPHEEIFPPEIGCHDEVLATQGTPLGGTTLLHMAIEFDEDEIFEWLIENGADINARSAIGENGSGGYTPLFSTVMSQPNFWLNYTGGRGSTRFTERLLELGADISIRGSIRKKLHPGYAPRYDTGNWHEYRNVTALEFGEQFHAKVFVSEPSLELLRNHSARGQ
jgi:ankyrin repeat protein